MTRTPISKWIMEKMPMSKWQKATADYPQKSSVRRPQIRTVIMLTKDAMKLTEHSNMVDTRGLSDPSPRTCSKICVEKSVIA